ncbi:hypothetical protein [Hyphomicrobium sp. ghe19]|uniref:hypothetical protein n=1 Tax=Hyphomicrobium sp. ghe19 TaxID=2682968 RepID=UPI001366DDD3|nr:hypothetical protein HYPP_02447 [Hyphomicrobium sp. ghe19]
MKTRFYFAWRGTYTRDCGTSHVDAESEDVARHLFKMQHPYRVITRLCASTPLPIVQVIHD